jgi:hypothetical protein
MSSAAYATGGWSLALNYGGNNICLFLENTGLDMPVASAVGTGVTRNTWGHVVGSYNSSDNTVNLYLNGVLVKTQIITTGAGTITNILYIGRPTQGGWNFFTGDLAIARIYNRALTAAEVNQNYLASLSRFAAPPVVIDSSLKLWLDAANPSSYSGTGSTWTDLSGTGNNGTIYPGVAYNASGWFDFTADTGEVRLANQPTGFAYGAAPGTISGWFKTSGTTGFILSYGASSTNNARYIGFISGSYCAGIWTNDLVLSSPSVVLDTWTHMAHVYDGTILYLYLNGVRVASGARTLNTLVNNANVGALTNYDRSSNKSIAQVQVYNRALSDNEIYQNYLALRGRFV